MSEAFDDYVHALPWAGTTGLDWSRMPPSMKVSVVGLSPEQVYLWAQGTCLGRHSHLSVWYSREDGGIIVSLHEGIVALDELYLHAPGPRFSFGMDMTDGIARPAFSDLLQYGYGDLLVAVE
jgi:hypothetical protein